MLQEDALALVTMEPATTATATTTTTTTLSLNHPHEISNLQRRNDLLTYQLAEARSGVSTLIRHLPGELAPAPVPQHQQIFPRPGWVEHDPEELFASQRDVAARALAQAGLCAADVAAKCSGLMDPAFSTTTCTVRSGLACVRAHANTG